MLDRFRKELKEIETLEEDYPGQRDEVRRNLIVRYAEEAAMNVVDVGSNGSLQEEEYLFSCIAMKFVERIHHTFVRELLMADFAARKA
jgi:hypothetical protein